ncbi:MAG: hypothetical protein ACI4V7_11090 [Succinivibrionaceae bacterium]
MFENNNNYNNGLYPYNQQIGAGAMGQQVPQYPINVGTAPPRATSTLSAEDRQIIKNSINKPLQITELDVAISHCNHVNPDSGIPDVYMCGVSEDGYPILHCNQCQSEFTAREYSKKGVEELVRMIIDFIHTIKIGWINPPKEYAEQIYSIQAMLEKFPQIFDKVQVDLDKIERTINNQYTCGNGYNNGNYFNIRSTPSWSLGGMQQPMMQPQYNNYGYPQQPQYQQVTPNYYQQPMMQQPTPMGGNPMTGQSPFVQGGQVPVSNMTQPQTQMNQPQQNIQVQPATTTVPPINNNTTPRIPTPGTATTTATIK